MSHPFLTGPALFLLAAGVLAAQSVPTPESHFGFEIGAERKLANWTELTSYYEELAQRSHRVAADTLGETTAGLPFVMLTITSPENHARIDELHARGEPRPVRLPAERVGPLAHEDRRFPVATAGMHERRREPDAPDLAHRRLLAALDGPPGDPGKGAAETRGVHHPADPPRQNRRPHHRDRNPHPHRLRLCLPGQGPDRTARPVSCSAGEPKATGTLTDPPRNAPQARQP